MKSLIVYSSKSGNTKKLAEAIYDYIAGEKEICAVSDAPDPSEYDFVAVGFWLQAGQPDPESQKFIAKVDRDQELYLFATHAAATDSPHVQGAMKSAKELASKARVVATFSCLGEVPEKVVEMASKKDPQPPWLDNVSAAVGHPDEKDLKDVARLLGELNLP